MQAREISLPTLRRLPVYLHYLTSIREVGATGMSARNFLQKLFDKLKPYGIELTLHSIENNFFGHTITVSGLVTATDIAKQLSGSKADVN